MIKVNKTVLKVKFGVMGLLESHIGHACLAHIERLMPYLTWQGNTTAPSPPLVVVSALRSTLVTFHGE